MSIIEKTLRWIAVACVFALPVVALIVASGFPFGNLFFPYITGKNFAFRILVEIMAGAWLALALVVPRWRPRRSWILAAFALFVLVMAIADAQGAYPFKSFWSNYERMDGWITIAHTLIFLVVSVSVLNTENLWRRLFQWSLAVSAFLSVLGFMQVKGILDLGSGGTGLGARVDATFGNPIYLAVYMLFHVFIAALLWYQMWVVRGKGKRLPASIFYCAVIILDTGALLFSGTRGTMLGLIGGTVLAFVLYAISPAGTRRMRTAVAAVLAVAVLIGFGLHAARDTKFVNSVGFLGRLASISVNDNTAKARFLNMSIAWQGVKERPILGWGQENYAIVFDKHYDPRMYAQEQWFDRVHNIIFDWWVAGGTLGLLAYLSIFAALLWALWKKGVFTAPERAILTGLFAGYFINNFFVFDNVTSYILFAMVLGYIAYREGAARAAPLLFDREILPRGAVALTAAVAVVCAGAGVWAVNASALAANRDIISAISPQGDINKNLSYFESAISLHTYGTQEAREQLAQLAMQVAGASVPADIKAQFVQTAVRELDLQAQQSPLDARFPLFAAAVLDASGNYTDAAAELARAHELSPDKQTILFEMAQNAMLRGDAVGMLTYFEDAYNLDTEDLDARLYYAAALIRAGQDAQADALLAPVVPTGQAADQRITGAYVARKEYAKLIPIWQAHVKADPSDTQGYFTLGAVYYAAGDSADAIAELTQAGDLSPAVKAQADKYIEQIRAGTLTAGQ